MWRARQRSKMQNSAKVFAQMMRRSIFFALVLSLSLAGRCRAQAIHRHEPRDVRKVFIEDLNDGYGNFI